LLQEQLFQIAQLPNAQSPNRKMTKWHNFLCVSAVIWTFMRSKILFLLLITLSAFAQHQSHEEKIGWVPRSILEKPITLKEGVGKIHDPVTTSSPEAQAFYEQGLAYLHSYVWIESARSFNQALRIDPKMAMAYVGLSRVYSNLNDDSSARTAAARARELASGVSERDRMHIELEAKRLEAVRKGGEQQQEYRTALEKALAADPKSTELMLLLGNASEDDSSGRGQGGSDKSIDWYKKVLELEPDNFAAHHYLIHSYENVGKIDQALIHGEAYERLAPNVPHAHHMYGHDLRRVGRVEEAIQRFQAADDLENAYYQSENIPREYDWHHPHNLDLLAMCYQYLGKMSRAEQLLLEVHSKPPIQQYQEAQRIEYAEFLLARSRNEDALKAARNLAENGQWPLGRAIAHTTAGNALLQLGKEKDAKKALKLADKEIGHTTHRGQYGNVYGKMLRANLLLHSKRDKQRQEGRKLATEVVSSSRSAKGPDAWIQALFRLELLDRIARDTNNWDLAANIAKQMQEHDANYAGTHYALALVTEHQGDASAAAHEFAAVEQAWSKADPDLPELKIARERYRAQK
jgi:tetratricopeptide (TPR) repeat protein